MSETKADESRDPGRERCDKPRTEMPGGRRVSNNRPLTSSRDVCKFTGSMTTAVQGHVYDLQHTHTHSLRQCTCLVPPTASDCHYDMPPLHSTLLQTLHLVFDLAQVLHPWMHNRQPSERLAPPTASDYCIHSTLAPVDTTHANAL